MRRFRLKVARLYAMIKDATALERASNEFTALAEEIIELNSST